MRISPSRKSAHALAVLRYQMAAAEAKESRERAIWAKNSVVRKSAKHQEFLDNARAVAKDRGKARRFLVRHGAEGIAEIIEVLVAARPDFFERVPPLDLVIFTPEVFVSRLYGLWAEWAAGQVASGIGFEEFCHGSADAADERLDQARRELAATLAAEKAADAELIVAIRLLESLEQSLVPVPPITSRKPRPPIRLRHVTTRSVLTAAPPARVFALAA